MDLPANTFFQSVLPVAASMHTTTSSALARNFSFIHWLISVIGGFLSLPIFSSRATGPRSLASADLPAPMYSVPAGW